MQLHALTGFIRSIFGPRKVDQDSFDPLALPSDEIRELDKSINDVSTKAAIIWTTFITFELYLAIAFGGVRHRDLLLETPIKLPILNADLPLVAFFIVAPAVLLAFHIYLLLVLALLGQRVALRAGLTATSDDLSSLREYRLDTFPLLQLLAGPRSQRSGINAAFLRFICWLTILIAPLVLILQAQLTFLPYHSQYVSWWLRGCLILNIAILGYFWPRIFESTSSLKPKLSTILKRGLSFVAAVLLIFFSVNIAVYPGEALEYDITGLEGKLFQPVARLKPPWSLILYQSEPRAWLQNRLVLLKEDFSSRKPDGTISGPLLRQRDLRGAMLDGADLRNADFTDAILDGASLQDTRLENANLTHASARRAEFARTKMNGANFWMATLDGSKFSYVQAEWSTFNSVSAVDLLVERSNLKGSDFGAAHLERARIYHSYFEGAVSGGAFFDAAIIVGSYFVGADLDGASFAASWLPGTHFEAANLNSANLQGANLNEVFFKGASLNAAKLWRAYGVPYLEITSLSNLDVTTPPWSSHSGCFECKDYDSWKAHVLRADNDPFDAKMRERNAAVLNPQLGGPELELLPRYWLWARAGGLSEENLDNAIGKYYRDLVCVPTRHDRSEDSSPAIARAVLASRYAHRDINDARAKQLEGDLESARIEATAFKACPGAKTFSANDWADIDQKLRSTERGLYEGHFTEIDRDIREQNLGLASISEKGNALMERGILYLQRNDIKHALEDFTESVALLPTNKAAKLYRGQALLLDGNATEAFELFDTILRTAPTDMAALTLRGRSNQMLGNLPSAIDDYAAALQFDPTYPVAHFLRGSALIASGRFEDAERDLDKAIDTGSSKIHLFLTDDADAHRLRGLAALMNGNYKKAMDDFDTARGNNTWAAIRLPGLDARQVQAFNHALILWRSLADAKINTGWADNLAVLELQQGSLNWPYPIIAMYVGLISEAQMLAAATSQRERCDAHFFAGAWHGLRSESVEAAAALGEALKQCEPASFESNAAAALSRLRGVARDK